MRSDLLRLARELLDESELLLQLLVIALQRAELRGLRREHAKQLLDLHLLRECDAPELLDFRLAPQVHGNALSAIALVSVPSSVPFNLTAERHRDDDSRRELARAGPARSLR